MVFQYFIVIAAGIFSRRIWIRHIDTGSLSVLAECQLLTTPDVYLDISIVTLFQFAKILETKRNLVFYVLVTDLCYNLLSSTI